jgi:hypothetical protein
MSGTALDTSRYVQEMAEQASALTDAVISRYSSGAAASGPQANIAAATAVAIQPVEATAAVQATANCLFGTSGSDALLSCTPTAAEKATTALAAKLKIIDKPAAVKAACAQEQVR